MPKTETQIVSAQLSTESVEQLRVLAAAAGRSLSSELRRAVREHLERERRVAV